MLPIVTFFGHVKSSLYPMHISMSEGGLLFSRFGRLEKLWQSINSIFPIAFISFNETSVWKSEYSLKAVFNELNERSV